MVPGLETERFRGVPDSVILSRAARVRDDDLRDELEDKRHAESVLPDLELRDLGDDVDPGDLAQETIVMRTGRPVLAILRN